MFLLTGAVFAGCGTSVVGPGIGLNGTPMSEEAAKELGEQMAEEILGGVDIEYAEEGTNETVSWPEQIPSDVPVFKYGKLDSSMAAPNESEEGSVAIQLREVPQDAYDKYEQDLEAAGWTITTDPEWTDTQLNAEKGTVTISIDKNPMGEGTAFFYYMP